MSDGKERPYADLVRWTILTGMAYLPSTTPPIGFDCDGLPVSFQVVGPYGGDYTTIRLAQMIAEYNGGYQRPPVG
jgi:amidase